MDLGLEGKVAIITGGSDGLGLATARRLAAEGAAVSICGRDRTRLTEAAEKLRADGATVLDVAADVTRADDLERLVSDHARAVRADRHPGQQRRHVGGARLRHRRRRGLAGRPRAEALRRDPLRAALRAGHAEDGRRPDRQHPQHGREDPGRPVPADLGQPCRGARPDEGTLEGARRGPHPRQRGLHRARQERAVGATLGGRGAARDCSRRSTRSSPASGACRSAAWGRRKSSARWSPSWCPRRPPSSPGSRSTSTAVTPRWCRWWGRPAAQLPTVTGHMAVGRETCAWAGCPSRIPRSQRALTLRDEGCCSGLKGAAR